MTVGLAEWIIDDTCLVFLQQLRKEAEVLKKEGNALYVEKDNESAIQKYTEALEVCPLTFKDDRAVFLANRAAAKVNQVLQRESLILLLLF